MTDGRCYVRREEESVAAGWKTITRTAKIISGEFEGDLIHVERGINIKQMLALVCRRLATREAARSEPSLRLWSKDMRSCSRSFCADLISERLHAAVPFLKSQQHVCGGGNGKKQAAAMLGSGGPEFNVIVCRRSNVEPVCWTHKHKRSRFYSRSAD